MVCTAWRRLERNHTVRCVIWVKQEEAAMLGTVFMLERFILNFK
jgi:hypothetical protein